MGRVKRTISEVGLLQTIGPGVMYAGAAIGVSHLVQSTRAGAVYGFQLVWVVIGVHLLKYPFFEFGHRYGAATRVSLLVGYGRVGRWALLGYLVIACGLSLPSMALLTVVTAGMASQVFALELSVTAWACVILVGCAAVLASGGYRSLDGCMKVLMVFLAVSTIVAVVAALGYRPPAASPDPPDVWNATGVAFLVALMGWMPTPVDASAWPSLWMQERAKQTGHRPTMREALIDFRIGYVGSLVMALMFLGLGALVMRGGGEPLPGQPDAFATRFVAMYTTALGSWSRPIVVTAAVITMLSTTLTVLDGYPRVFATGWRLLQPTSGVEPRTLYGAFVVAMVVGALLIITLITSHLRHLVDFVTTLAFLSAPLFAYLNHHVVRRLPLESRPSAALHWLSLLGLVFLVCFSGLFLCTRG